MGMVKENVNHFLNFVHERENVRLNKEAGQPAPWTDDSILREYRFCNVSREHDHVTRWIAKHWRGPWANEPDLFFAMAVARLFNWPDTLAALGVVTLPFKPGAMRAILQKRKAQGKQVFGPAYIVSTNGLSMDKVEYLIERVFEPMWESRREYRPRPGDTLEAFWKRLTEAQGFGSFMAAQVVADVKNAAVGPLSVAADWYTWAAPGPGSLRGMNRILGNGAIRTGIRYSQFLSNVTVLRHQISEHVGLTLCSQDVQNCLCEFDKYERARLGEGTPKQKYVPANPSQRQGVLL